VDEHTGFRYYQLTADDFMLNGSSFKLRGVSKHQETEYSASAATDAELTIDWDNLQDLGMIDVVGRRTATSIRKEQP
jgi:beta-galactosidase/beta-glucuronidase